MSMTPQEQAQAAHEIAQAIVDSAEATSNFTASPSFPDLPKSAYEPFDLDFSPWADNMATPMHVKIAGWPPIAQMFHLSLTAAHMPHRIVQHYADGTSTELASNPGNSLPQPTLTDSCIELVVQAKPAFADIAANLPEHNNRVDPAFQRVWANVKALSKDTKYEQR